MAFFSGLLHGYRRAFDPPGAPPAQMPLAPAYRMTVDTARRFQELQAEHRRLQQQRRPRNLVSGRGENSGPMSGNVATAAGAVADSGQPGINEAIAQSVIKQVGRSQFFLDEQIAREKMRGSGELNAWGYRPTRDDRELLARIIYAESFNTPEDDVAIGWATINRVGRPGFANTLEGVLRQPRAFQIVSEGNPGRSDNPRWTETAHPQNLPAARLARLARANDIADGILSGRIADPTGNAVYFHSSDNQNDPTEDSPWFADAFRNGTIVKSIYTSRARGPRRNYFYNAGKARAQQ
jgi:hypothetical protein